MAESGWDFSSRWYGDKEKMKTVEITDILPVDLNALLCWNVNILKYFADSIGTFLIFIFYSNNDIL